MQSAPNRRFAKGLTISTAYTWSKAMGYVDSDGDSVAQYRPIRVWNYGKLGPGQTHVFVANYIWDLPKGSKLVNNGIGRFLLDNWQVSGITTFASGRRQGIGFTLVDKADLSGGGDVYRRPGQSNWDISFFKNIPLLSEKKKLQFRWEMYNAFNHTQFDAVDNTARFDAQGRQVNTRFGEIIGARMQASLRFSF